MRLPRGDWDGASCDRCAFGYRGANCTVASSWCADGVPSLLTAATGWLQSNGEGNYYDDLMRCDWYIRAPDYAPTPAAIELTVHDLHLEEGYDFAVVYDGNSTNGTVIGRWTGYSTPPTVRATSGALHVRFRSDEYETRAGFSAQYRMLLNCADADACDGHGACANDTCACDARWDAARFCSACAPGYDGNACETVVADFDGSPEPTAIPVIGSDEATPAPAPTPVPGSNVEHFTALFQAGQGTPDVLRANLLRYLRGNMERDAIPFDQYIAMIDKQYAQNPIPPPSASPTAQGTRDGGGMVDANYTTPAPRRNLL